MYLVGQVGTVTLAPAGDVPLQGQTQGPGQERQGRGVQAQRYTTAHRHLTAMAHEAEARNICTGMGCMALHHPRGLVVEGGHRRHCSCVLLIAELTFLERCREDACA